MKNNVIQFPIKPNQQQPEPPQQETRPQQPEPEQTPGIVTYCPEMKDSTPAHTIHAKFSYYSGKYAIRTELELKGRGILLTATQGPLNYYTVTEKAFERLGQKYAIAMETFLD